MNILNQVDYIPPLIKIAPNIRFNYIKGDGQYLTIISDEKTINHFLADDLTFKVLEYLKDKQKSTDIIERLLAEGEQQQAVENQLFLLVRSNIIIDASYQMSDALASFWIHQNITPVTVERKLARHRIHIINHSRYAHSLSVLQQTMKLLGLNVVQKTDKATLVVVLSDDYLQPAIAEINQDFYQTKQTWMLIQLAGILPLLGPVFNANNGFCYQCLYKRIRDNRQMHNTLGRYQEDAELIHTTFCEPEALKSIAYQFCLELMNYLLNNNSKLNQHLLSFSWSDKTFASHQVQQLPQCAVCGKPQNIEAAIKPFVFDKPDKTIKTSGGYKAVSPEQTLAKYSHLVSPISGVIDHLALMSPIDDDWLFVYESGNNIALKTDNIYLAFASVRMLNAGKGTSRQQAKVSALAESIERYCSAFQGDEIRKTAKFTDFKAGEALLPNTVMHYSERQYQHAHEVNQKMSTFHHVPKPIDKSTDYEWSPIWDILNNKEIWVPTQLLYFTYPYGNQWIASADTNGTASGNSKTEAFIQAFLELIERDNIAIWWNNRLQYPRVDLQSFPHPHIQQAAQVYATRYGRDLWAIDVSSDTDIATFVVLSYEKETTDSQDILFSAASHFDANIAMLRALCEHNQLMVLVKNNKRGKEYHQLSHEFAYWLKNAKIEHDDYHYLLPNDEVMTFKNYPNLSDLPLEQQKQLCLDLIKRKDWQIYICDFTRADIDMPVIRVIVPQLRTMHTRLDEGRLYEVPVLMGKLNKPLTEEELNPIAIFI